MTSAATAGAFPHVVQEGETVAQLAERIYGRLELERVIVAANALDARGASGVVPGMRLELPAVGHHIVLPGETWQSIAAEALGSGKRGEVLAQLNGAQGWLAPAAGSAIIVPYALRYVASNADTTQTVAYRFLGHRDRAWVVGTYNGLKRAKLKQGEVLLVPLTDLALTEEGRREALAAESLVHTQAGGQAREAQRVAESRIPQLVADVRHGRYVEAVRRGEGLLASAGLSRPQRAVVYRQLTEAYVALEADGLAADACAEWRRADAAARLDPVALSPKIIRACAAASFEPSAAPTASATAATAATSAAPSAVAPPGAVSGGRKP